ncbi:MAG: HAD-IB family phosphatase [Gammaproteobacteria bacterium]|nr:HAD-IB family phosphatase [Gammaproteobacteria bacterium]
MKLVLFDLDGTLLGGLSSERRFIRALALEGQLGPRQWFAQGLFVSGGLFRYGRDVLRKNKAYLSGLQLDAVAERARQLVETEMTDAFLPGSLARLRQHQRSGDRVVLLSGTPEFLLRPIADWLGVEQIMGTRCALRRGRFTAAAPLRHPFGPDKLVLARSLCLQHRVDLKQVIAYADSVHDRRLLSAAGMPVAVMPDRGLGALARARGWEVLT